MKKFETIEGKPWLTVEGIYLIFDYVHLLKNIRNLWLTEKNGKLEFEDEEITLTADWQHLRDLYNEENGKFLKMSDLDEVAVYPKPIERQSVCTCLKVFSEKTAVALEIYGNTHDVDVSAPLSSSKKYSHGGPFSTFKAKAWIRVNANPFKLSSPIPKIPDRKLRPNVPENG